jgi:hypothetical protein
MSPFHSQTGGSFNAFVPDDDPLAIYKPSGAKQVDAAKAMGNFTGWTLRSRQRHRSEVANIQFRQTKAGRVHEMPASRPPLKKSLLI